MVGDELRARSRQFGLDVVDLCLRMGTDELARLVRPQLLRSGTSVMANCRAAGRSRSRREFIAKLGVTIEEADESELWLDVLETRKHQPLDEIIALRREASELVAIFTASRQTAIANAKPKKR